MGKAWGWGSLTCKILKQVLWICMICSYPTYIQITSTDCCWCCWFNCWCPPPPSPTWGGMVLGRAWPGSRALWSVKMCNYIGRTCMYTIIFNLFIFRMSHKCGSVDTEWLVHVLHIYTNLWYSGVDPFFRLGGGGAKVRKMPKKNWRALRTNSQYEHFVCLVVFLC